MSDARDTNDTNDTNDTGATSKRAQQAEQRRAQLIDAALDLFSRNGFEATRVADIAHAAGVAQGLLYYYFPTKEALLAAIIERYGPLQMLSEVLAAPTDRPAREMLRSLATSFYALIQERRALLRLLAREIIWQPEMLGFAMAVREQALAMLTSYLQSRVAAGELRPHDWQVVGQLFISNVMLVSVAGLPIDPYLTGAIDVILQGIAAHPDGATALSAETTTGG